MTEFGSCSQLLLCARSMSSKVVKKETLSASLCKVIQHQEIFLMLGHTFFKKINFCDNHWQRCVTCIDGVQCASFDLWCGLIKKAPVKNAFVVHM